MGAESRIMSDATNKRPELQADTLELINTELADRLSRQTAARRQVDTKAALLVGYVAAASSFLATRHSQSLLTWLAFAAVAVAVAVAAAAVCRVPSLCRTKEPADKGSNHHWSTRPWLGRLPQCL